MSLLDNSAFLLAFLIACSAKTTILLALAWSQWAPHAVDPPHCATSHGRWGFLGSLTLPFALVTATCVALGRAGKCCWSLGPSARNSFRPQFSDIAFDDRGRRRSISAVRQVSRLGPAVWQPAFCSLR